MSTILRARQTAPVAAVALGVLTLGAGLATLSLDRLAHQPGSRGPVDWLFTVLVLVPVGFAVLPVCVGVAVLKYKLYSIDRIISRVISYAIITAVLAGVFAGLALLATEVLPVKTPVAVAAATLAAAALFNPLRRRVQRIVDRRFNRSRYNADAILAAFTAQLRQTVDLDTVRSDLVGVVCEAFQPALSRCGSPSPGWAQIRGWPERIASSRALIWAALATAGPLRPGSWPSRGQTPRP